MLQFEETVYSSSYGMLLFQIESGMVEKQYIAKVVGVFPEDEVSSSSHLSNLQSAMLSS